MNIVNDIQLDFSDVLIQPKRSNLNSRSEVNLYRQFKRKDKNNVNYCFDCIPVCSANMGTVGTTNVAKSLVELGLMCALEKHYGYDDIMTLYNDVFNLSNNWDKCNRIAISTGIKESLDVIHRIDESTSHGVNIINIDVANGYQQHLIDRVKEVRNDFPHSWIIVGNVVTPDIVQDLIFNGADIIKLGIGPGSVCRTREKTGVGRPQLSTIIDCADAAHQLHAYVMADGGCTCSGDICKAFCAGSDFVMCGSMFAGTDEAEGSIVEKDGVKRKLFYGMSSNYAQEKHFGGIKNYRTSEGREVYIPYVGSIKDVVTDICGGIASCCTYIGSHCIKHMSKHTTFYRVNNQLNTKYINCPTL